MKTISKLMLMIFVFGFPAAWAQTAETTVPDQTTQTAPMSAETQGKMFLKQEIDRMVQYLSYLQKNAVDNDELSEKDRDTIIREVEAAITWLENKKRMVDSITYAEIRPTAEDIRDYWREQGPKVKKALGKIQATRTGAAIKKANLFGTRVESSVGHLSQLQENFLSFHETINVAKQKHLEANQTFDKITSTENEDQYFQEGNEALKEANQNLRESYNILRAIIQEIKAMRAETE